MDERNNNKAGCSPAKSCSKEFELGNLSARMESIEEKAEDLHDAQIRLFGKLDKLIPAVAQLQVKASVWGAIGGVLVALIALAMKFL